MRLLNAKTLELQEFVADVPPYSILSHAWGKDEVTFKELDRNGGKYTVGRSEKIDGFRKESLKDGFEWLWIDTCCIDKSSSAELQEAINSMFRWYRDSEVCFAYLSDVHPGQDPTEPDSAFRASRWFTRGWTLQELLAPIRFVMFDSEWTRIGWRSSHSPSPEYPNAKVLTQAISDVTRIPTDVVEQYNYYSQYFTVAEKLSWAARRATTRVEDRAYSLLGILDVNMTMMYGEGERAFVRLQDEVMKIHHDSSLFSWRPSSIPERISFESKHDPFLPPILADSPSSFVDCSSILSFGDSADNLLKLPSHFSMTGKGLFITTHLYDIPWAPRIALMRLDCTGGRLVTSGSQIHSCLAVPLFKLGPQEFGRTEDCSPLLVPSKLFFDASNLKTIYVSNKPAWPSILCKGCILVSTKLCPVSVVDAFPRMGICPGDEINIIEGKKERAQRLFLLVQLDGDNLVPPDNDDSRRFFVRVTYDPGWNMGSSILGAKPKLTCDFSKGETVQGTGDSGVKTMRDLMRDVLVPWASNISWKPSILVGGTARISSSVEPTIDARGYVWRAQLVLTDLGPKTKNPEQAIAH